MTKTENKVIPYSTKNCNIIMKDGTVKFNDQMLGLNLDKFDIEQCLRDVGYYELCTKEKAWERIYADDVKEIVEIEG